MKEQWAHREGSNAIQCQTQHLLQRIFRLTCESLTDNIIYRSMLQSDHRNKAAQIEVVLLVGGQHIESFTAHQTEVGMIIDTLDAHRTLQFIKGLSGQFLHERISLT